MAKQSWHHHCKVAPAIERTSSEGILFHSKTEMQRWEYLKLLQRAGEITNLERQVKFPLHTMHGNKYYDISVKAGPPDSQKIAHYTADFVYAICGKEKPIEGYVIIEDVKGYRDENSKFRIRVFEAFSGSKVTIVKKLGRRWVEE